MAPRRGAVALPESLEHVTQEILTDALPGVGDDHQCVGIRAVQLDLDPAALGCELHGVGQQIPQNLAQSIGIAGHDDLLIRIDDDP